MSPSFRRAVRMRKTARNSPGAKVELREIELEVWLEFTNIDPRWSVKDFTYSSRQK